MEELFDTIYLYTSGLYGQELDNYLYDMVPGYVHVGLIMACLSLAMCLTFYYIVKPVIHQMRTWLICVGLNAFLNFIVALWYTITPLINNEIDPSEEWAVLDTFGFGVANIIWSIVFLLVFSLLFKWWSPAKYIPFRKF